MLRDVIAITVTTDSTIDITIAIATDFDATTID